MAVFRPKPPSLVIKGEKGRGSYGTVCHGDLEGKPVMIKRIHEILLTSSRSDQLRKFEQECQILETLHHPNIVRSLGAFWDDATREPLLVMEPMRENLRDYLERRKQADAQLSVDDHLSIALSIAEGLKFLHEQKQPIAHRDLNDKNILVGEDGSVKIGDFGQSTLLAGSTEYMGTMAPGAFVFMPPEALMDEPHYNLKVDSFSMGVLMLEVSTQMPPPARMSNIGSSQEVERRSKDLALLDSCHPLKPLIIWCLQNQYKLRPDVATIHSQLMTLKHPELQQKVKELQTGLREAELHSLQLEGTLQKSNEQMEVLKGDNKNLETELEVTKEKVLKQTLDLEEQNRTLEQWKNENEQLEGQLKSSRDRESQLMLQLRQTERALADKQALQEELTRRLRQKDEEIAVLSSENEAMASYARDSLKKLQDIKSAVETVTSAVDKIDENCTKSGKRDNKRKARNPEVDTLAADALPGLKAALTLPTVCPSTSHTSPQSTSSGDTTLPLPNGGMLTVKRGDLLKERVTAIVNAANDQLDHIGGVALAIDRASGGNVQRESRRVIQKSGRVPTGQVAVTGAGGRLQCQSVIHAVGPDANERPHKECEQLLKLVCENVLRTAEAQGMGSVALPAIGSGIYAMKKDVVAQILISAILHYPYQHSSTLKDIRIVLSEEETLRPFLQFASEVKQRIPPATAQRVIPVARSPDVVDIPMEKTHRKMVIKKGHFIYEDADIKVAAICSELGFGTGYSKELDGHLKGQLSEAVRVRYQYHRPDRFDVFTVHVQHASINCRYLVIVNILDRSLGTRHDAHKCLQQIVQAVCQEADTLEMPSVAIAPKTFAVGGFQPEHVLPEFIHTLSQFKFTNQDFLTDVRFLALDPDTFDILIAGAERAIGRSLKQPPKHTQAPPQQPPQPGPAGGRSNMSGHQISKEVTYRPGGAADHVGKGTPGTGQPPTRANPVEVQQHASSTFVVYDDVVEIPLEKTHRKMVIKKAHFIYEDADIKVATICSELGFQIGSNKELDGHLKGQLSEAVRARYQHSRPDRFDVFTVHVQHASINCRYLVIVNILDRSLGTRHDAHKCLQQIVQAVCQEADTLEMPSVVIAPSTFSLGGFQVGSILSAFITMINDFKFTNDDFVTDVRFLALDQNSFTLLIAGAERHIGKSLRKPVQSSHSTGSYLHGTGTAGASEQGSQEHSTVSQVQTSPPHPFNVGSHQTGHGVGASTTGAADAPSIPSVSIPFQQGRNLTIKKGNLVEEAVEAIVNSTDEHLQHSSGVAKAINEASGRAVQTALNNVVARMGGGAPSGRVVVTAAGGSLRCDHVIHAVWPAARERSNEGYERLLKELCQEVICAAEERQLKSMALPPMTSGSCELSKEMIAQIIIDSILHYPFPVNCLMTDIRIVISDDETWSPFLKYAVEVKKSLPAACAWSTASKRNVRSQSHFTNDGPHEWQSSPAPGATVSHSTTYLPTTPLPAEDMVEIPLEKTHRKMVIKKAHFLYEDADIKVAAICSELGFVTGSNKELDGHLKGQLSEAVRGRYQYHRPDRFDVFTVHVQHATISCRYLVVVNILDRSLGTRHNAHKCLQQILQAVCQEADTLEMPSVVIAPNTFSAGGFQKGSILPEFIRVISHFRFTNDDFFSDVRFVANQNAFNSLVADAERTVGRVLRRIPQLANVTNQPPMDPAHSSSSRGPPAPVVGGVPVTPPAIGMCSSKDTQLPSPGPGMTKLSEHVFFSLVCGDLCKVQADAVVVPVGPLLDLKSGVVQAVDTASGGDLTRAVKQIKQTKQTVLEGTVIPVAITSGLNCKQAILLIRNAKGTTEALDHACQEALKLAEGLGARSVTFPPISPNKGKDKLARCMMGAFASFHPQNPQYAVTVTVVVRENDEAMLKAFRSFAGEGTTDWRKDEMPHPMNPVGDKFVPLWKGTTY